MGVDSVYTSLFLYISPPFAVKPVRCLEGCTVYLLHLAMLKSGTIRVTGYATPSAFRTELSILRE